MFLPIKIKTEDENYILCFAPYEVDKALGIIKQLAQIQFPCYIFVNEQGTLTIYIQGEPELDWKGLGVEVKTANEIFKLPSGGSVLSANKANQPASPSR